MKMRTENRPVLRIGGGEEGTFRIAATSKMVEMLSSGVYSDKVLAVIRELSCNAHDAHIAAGNPDPIMIHLPTILEPYFSVKDNGIGLSHEDIMSLYTTYGESTKDASNAFIGAFGIGSKAPFAYTDQFTVTSRFNGVERTYVAFKNEGGMPVIKLMGEKKTKEHNGLEVTVAVDETNFTEFNTKARKFFTRFTPRPTITGLEGEIPEINYAFSGTGWATTDQHEKYSRTISYAIQGNVAYPIDSSKFSNKIGNILDFGVDLMFDIGQVEIATSREALSYVDSTISAINKAVENFIKEFPAMACDSITKAKSLWDAHIAFNKLKDDYYRIKDLFDVANITWNGQKVTGDYKIEIKDYQNSDGTGIGIVVFERNTGWNRSSECKRRRHSDAISYNGIFTVKPGKHHRFYIDDLGRGMQARIRAQYDEYSLPKEITQTTVFSGPANMVNKLKKTFGDGVNFIKVSTLPKPTSTKVAGKHPDANVTMWLLDLNNGEWIPDQVSPTKSAGGYFVPFYRKKVVTPKHGEMQPYDFIDLLRKVAKAGGVDLTTSKKIYGIPKRLVEKGLDTTKWKSVFDMLSVSVNKVVSADAEYTAIAKAFNRYNLYIDYNAGYMLNIIADNAALFPANELVEFAKAYKISQQYNGNSADLTRYFDVSNKIPDYNDKYSKMWVRVSKKYGVILNPTSADEKVLAKAMVEIVKIL